MRLYQIVLTTLLAVASLVAIAQQKSFIESAPLELPMTGYNKIVCMKNGNTVLLHMEPHKHIEVLVFDSTHQLVARAKDAHHHLCMGNTETSKLRGVFEISGEVTLFVEQEKSGRATLLRDRFDGSTGKLIEDKIVGRSPTRTRKTSFRVVHSPQEDNYAIVFCTDQWLLKQSDVKVSFYNQNHELTDEVPLEVDRKHFDYMTLIGAEILKNGVCISLGLDKETVVAKPNHKGVTFNGGSLYDHKVESFYIPKGAKNALHTMIDLSTGHYPIQTFFSYNPFAENFNSLIFDYRLAADGIGLAHAVRIYQSDIFLRTSTSDLSVGSTIIKNTIASKELRRKTGVGVDYSGIPVKFSTDDNGMTTLVSQNFQPIWTNETSSRRIWEAFFGAMCVTKIGDNGEEIWGVVLPMSHYLKSYKRTYSVDMLLNKEQESLIFGDYKPQVYDRQFALSNQYEHKGNLYIVFNDVSANFNSSMEHPGDTVYNFESTNPVYYKIDRKNQVTKNYLFGAPESGVYRPCFTEGAAFDSKRGLYASLVQYKKSEEFHLEMTWSKFE